MQNRNRKAFSFSFDRKLPVPSTLHAPAFTLLMLKFFRGISETAYSPEFSDTAILLLYHTFRKCQVVSINFFGLYSFGIVGFYP